MQQGSANVARQTGKNPQCKTVTKISRKPQNAPQFQWEERQSTLQFSGPLFHDLALPRNGSLQG